MCRDDILDASYLAGLGSFDIGYWPRSRLWDGEIWTFYDGDVWSRDSLGCDRISSFRRILQPPFSGWSNSAGKRGIWASSTLSHLEMTAGLLHSMPTPTPTHTPTNTHTHTCIYIYIYTHTYVCMCVCVLFPGVVHFSLERKAAKTSETPHGVTTQKTSWLERSKSSSFTCLYFTINCTWKNACVW